SGAERTPRALRVAERKTRVRRKRMAKRAWLLYDARLAQPCKHSRHARRTPAPTERTEGQQPRPKRAPQHHLGVARWRIPSTSDLYCLNDSIGRGMTERNSCDSRSHRLGWSPAPQVHDRCPMSVRFQESDTEVFLSTEHERPACRQQPGRILLRHLTQKLRMRARDALEPAAIWSVTGDE